MVKSRAIKQILCWVWGFHTGGIMHYKAKETTNLKLTMFPIFSISQWLQLCMNSKNNLSNNSYDSFIMTVLIHTGAQKWQLSSSY